MSKMTHGRNKKAKLFDSAIRIIAASHYANRKGIRFEVIDLNDKNAFATGGGNFAVHNRLMKAANDDELAYVIAHELVHNVANHADNSFRWCC